MSRFDGEGEPSHRSHLPSVVETERMLFDAERRVETHRYNLGALDKAYTEARTVLAVNRRRYLANGRMFLWVGLLGMPTAGASIFITGWGTALGSWLTFATIVAILYSIVCAVTVSDQKSAYKQAKKTRAEYRSKVEAHQKKVADDQGQHAYLTGLHDANRRLPAKVRFLADALQMPDQTVTAIRTASISLVKPGSLWGPIGRAAGWDDSVTVLVEELSKALDVEFGRR